MLKQILSPSPRTTPPPLRRAVPRRLSWTFLGPAICCLVLVVESFPEFMLARAARSWPGTKGTLISVNQKSGGKEDPELLYEYDYAVDGNRHTLKNKGKPLAAEPTTGNTTIYYDPANPTRATVDNQGPGSAVLWKTFGGFGGFVLFAAGFILFRRRHRLTKNSTAHPVPS